jgi:hypothetical protein
MSSAIPTFRQRFEAINAESHADTLPGRTIVGENSEFSKKRQQYEEEMRWHEEEFNRLNPNREIRLPNERTVIG